MKAISKWVQNNLSWLIVLLVAILCVGFIVFGHKSDGGFITLDGNDATITETTKEWIEDANDALARIMNQDQPTDQETIAESDSEATGQGFTTSLEQILSRRLSDGHNDSGKGWQCSRYTGYLATGKWSYSSTHPDYGPVNGKDVAAWLVKNYGFKYIETPVEGAIGSGGWNTTYGHTAMYLYSTGANTAMVNDANYKPLTVATHNMNISGWVWVVPGDYTPAPKPTPTPTPAPKPTVDENGNVSYTYKKGDTFGQVLVDLGLDEGNLWGDGTVKRYTEQLNNQGIYGNIPVGKTIQLNVK